MFRVFAANRATTIAQLTFRPYPGRYSISYRVTEFGQFTPPPTTPVLDLTLVSVDEAAQVVRLRNRVDGEILRLPFNCLASEDDYKRLHEVRAAKRPNFLPPYPRGKEILPPVDDPNVINIAFQSEEPPARVAAFYKQHVLEAGFTLENEDSGVDAGRPYAGFRALNADGGRVIFSAFQSSETHAQAMYFNPR